VRCESCHAGKLERLCRYVSRPPVAIGWTQRLKRIFGIDIAHCPGCGGKLKIIASIEQPLAPRTGRAATATGAGRCSGGPRSARAAMPRGRFAAPARGSAASYAPSNRPGNRPGIVEQASTTLTSCSRRRASRQSRSDIEAIESDGASDRLKLFGPPAEGPAAP
jgi:hypothetical protein